MRIIIFAMALLWTGVQAKDFKKETKDLTEAYKKCIRQLQKSNYKRNGKQYFVVTSSGEPAMLMKGVGEQGSFVGIFSTDPNDLAGLKRVPIQLPQVQNQVFSFKEQMKADEAISVGFSCQPTFMSVMSGGDVGERKISRFSMSTEPLYAADHDRKNTASHAIKSFVVDFLKDHPEAIDDDIRSTCSRLNDPSINTHLNRATGSSAVQSSTSSTAQ
jgi:hypothetical protein